jgi:hypothetical protein
MRTPLTPTELRAKIDHLRSRGQSIDPLADDIILFLKNWVHPDTLFGTRIRSLSFATPDFVQGELAKQQLQAKEFARIAQLAEQKVA